MLNKFSILALLQFLLYFSCNPSEESSEEEVLTATINDQNWEFYDVTVNRNGQDVEVRGKGYLNGDRGAVPVNLQMTIVALPENEEIELPYTAYFAPGTTEFAAYATIIPEDSQIVYDTKLDPNARGKLTITEADENKLSGEFGFIAVDEAGRKLEVTDGKFKDLRLEIL